MGILGAISKILGKKPATQDIPIVETIKAPAPRPAPSRSLLDCRPDIDESDIALGVRYGSKYTWQILPPAGWRRQESTFGPQWPAEGSSPWVTFANPDVRAPDQAMIRWHLLSVWESNRSHQQLEDLLWGKEPLTAASVQGLEAPGLVAGMKVEKVERVHLGGVQRAILIATRLEQCKGEPAVLRYILVFPDREIVAGGEPRWYRESLQYIATEKSFWDNEPQAAAALKTFRRTAEVQTMSGAFLAVTPQGVGSVR